MIDRMLRAGVAALVLICGAWISFAAVAAADVGTPPIGPTPKWVEHITADAPQPNNKQLQYLLIDRQEKVGSHGYSDFTHFAIHLANQSSVDEESHVQINYIPQNEWITLHSMTIRRGAAISDALAHAKISTLRREVDLENRILDGELTINIVLEDVRVGDVLEYAYTRETMDDGLQTRFSARFTNQWSVPVKHSYLRVLFPQDRDIKVKDSALPSALVLQEHPDSKELTWDLRDIAAVVYEDSAPDTVFQYSRVELSEYSRWEEVSSWAASLYPNVAPSGEMRDLVRRWQSESPSKAEQIVRALRFVQDEIRYTGLEIGPGAFRPQSPEVVLQRRFGDCKEKTYLLVTLLRALDVDAKPALVNTRRKAGLRNLLPTANAFDHVIARVEYEGKIYWFDATAALQGGGLETIDQAHYAVGLVVDIGGKLESIPDAEQGPPTQDVTERFDLSAGVFKPAKMDVESVYSGGQADDMRSFLAANSLDDVQRTYLNFYKDEFPTVSVAAPITVSDDRDSNRLVVNERYTLDSAFVKNSDDDSHYFEMDAHVIRTAAAAPKTIIRNHPLAVEHPKHVRYRSIVHLPEPWKIEPVTKRIDTDQFSYESTVHYAENTVTAYYDFKTRAASVPAAGAATYAHKLDEVRKDAYYYLTYAKPVGKTQTGGVSYVMITALMLGCGLAIVLGRWLLRYSDPAFPAPARSRELAGLGGWLFLPSFGTVVGPLVLVGALYACRGYFNALVWANLGPGQDPVIVHWCKIAFFFGFTLFGALLPLSVLLIFLLFWKRRSFPMAFVVVQWMAVTWAVLIVLGAHWLKVETDAPMDRDFVSLAREVVISIVWTAYMLKSERVRATFVNPPPRKLSAETGIREPDLAS